MNTGPILVNAEYILPLKWADDADLDSLCRYLEELSRWIRVTVVDGSPEHLYSAHSRTFPSAVRHCRPLGLGYLNGKVEGVLTGMWFSDQERVVIADDDVRYTGQSLQRIVALLTDADVVRPQNYFPDLLPWHARWDTARTLINRAFGSDYPGTLAVRRSTLLEAGGYSGDVLFENLELLRTIRAAGGREVRADDLFVPRIPCSARHFRRQRVRQAYDDFAQPGRLVLEAALMPLILLSLKKPAWLAGLAGAGVLAAEAGRRRASGRDVFRADTSLWAPLWILERAICVWAAAGCRLRGGVPYAVARLSTAGHSVRWQRQRMSERTPAEQSVQAAENAPH